MIDYQSILEQVGYPTDLLCLDFETYLDDEYSLSKMSTIEYINDPQFEFTGVGWQWPDSNEIYFEGGEKHTREAVGAMKVNWFDETTWLIQNARFDVTILQTKFGIIPKYIIDLKDLACHYDARMSHRLKDMANMFGLKPKGETMNFKGLRWVTMTLEQRQALKEYAINDVELETELAKILLPKLTNPKEELALARHTLDLWLHQSFNLDIDAANKLRVAMRAKIAGAIQNSGHTPKELRSKKFVQYLNDILPDGEKTPTKKNKKGKDIPALAKTDEACQQLAIHPKKEIRDLITARLAVKSWPTHVLRISTMMAQTKANGGTLRVSLNYYGGHTGRWSGGEGYNLQNMAGEGQTGQENDPLMQQIRTLIKPPVGHVVCTVDSAQIEARVVAWLAGQQDLLDGFAAGKDVYSQFATTVFQHPVRKPRKSDPKTLYSMLKLRRGFGKQVILAAGYGMGAERFYQNCLKNPALRPFFDSGQYDFAFVKRLITTYRTTYPKIPEYWTKVEQAFRQALRFEHLIPEVGKTKFWCEGDTVHIQLPSGRVLYYRHTKIDKKNSLKYHHGPLWGGTITENIDQAISRDLLGYWILECEKAGIPITLHIHDDTRTILPKDRAEEIAERQAAIMRTVPIWAKNLPVDTEIKIGDTL